MRKEILIASFVAAIMLLLPMTTVAREADVHAQIVEEPNNGQLSIELTDEELNLFYKSFENLFEDTPEQFNEVNQVIDDAVTRSRDGVVTLDLEQVSNDLTPILNELSVNTRSAGMGVFGEQQATRVAMPGGFEIDDLELLAEYIWNNFVRPLLNFNSDKWPEWREDNDYEDHDGPTLDGEKDESLYDVLSTSEKYDYQGLDDIADWGCMKGFLMAFGMANIGLVLCILTLVFIVGLCGLPSVFLAYGSAYCMFVEAFDFQDLPYGSQIPYLPPDGF
jgi:hypothetical protein